MNKKERNNFISSNLESKNGADLGNFIYHLKQSKIDLNKFEKLLLEKLKSTKFPYDINILTETLIENPKNKSEIESVLNSKIKIWDTGNWSEKMWNFIKSNNLNVEKPNHYTLENNSSKKYNIRQFVNSKIENEEIGKNPLLMVDWQIVSYEEGKLIETLEKLDIKQIDYTSKNQSVSLYGKRGMDGLLQVTTN
ncbi:hypothetical protein [Soonwooa purpurea]